MNYGKAIYNILSNDSDVNSAVNGRIYPVRGTQGVSFPYIVYSLVSSPPVNVKQAKAPVDQPTYQISVFGKTKTEVADISDKVRSAMERTSGTFKGIDVADISYDGTQDLYDEDQDVHLMTVDFVLFIQRT